VEDDDGCPDEKLGKPLVTIVDDVNGKIAELRVPPRFVKDDVDPKTLTTLRALAQTLNANPEWIAAVATKPAGATARAEQTALNHAFAIVLSLRWLTHRDEAAEAVAWSAVQGVKGAAGAGLGVLILAPPAPAPPAPAPAPPPPAPSPAPASGTTPP
jgi:hypothetical protein